jgi:hypothetical protein
VAIAGGVLAFAADRFLVEPPSRGATELDLVGIDGSKTTVVRFGGGTTRAGTADFDGTSVTWGQRRLVKRRVRRCKGHSRRCRKRVTRRAASYSVLVERAP